MTPDAWIDRAGLCSVTLRRKPAVEVIAIARAAGLHRIEWGADVHAPPGDLARLSELGDRTRAAGLTVASYGSYWRAGVSSPDEVLSVVDGAVALGAPRVRVWAGDVGTREARPEVWDHVVDGLRAAAAVAADRGVELALEFHPDTLTDTVESALSLLERVGSTTLRTYWQPRLDEPTAPALAGLDALLPHLAAVHVFSWWPGAHRLPLTDRIDLWQAVIGRLQSVGEPCDLLLEFVEDDDVAALDRDARTLLDLLPPDTSHTDRT